MNQTARQAKVGRPRAIDEATLNRIFLLKESGASFQKIADQLGYGKTTIIEAINGRKPPRPVANDNHPDRVRVLAAHNGGCSTTSGYMPVTLHRVPTLDKPLLPCVAMDAANDNAPLAHWSQQVAA